MGVETYDPVAANNTTISGIAAQGGNLVSNFDNIVRQMAADIATARLDGQLASMPYRTTASNGSVAVTDRGTLINCSATVELELPAVATAGAGFYFIAKANGGTVTLDPNGTEQINGSSTSATVSDGFSAIVVCNGSAWFTVTIGAGNVTTTGTQTLTNKTLTSPTINSPTIATPEITTSVTFTRTDDGSTGPVLTFNHESASPAASDIIAVVQATGEDSAGNDQTYGEIYARILDPTSGSEDADWLFRTAVAGTVENRVLIGAGLHMNGATGGDPGAGKVNATEVQENGIALGYKLTSDTAQVTTSGTSKDFTSIPSWVKRITVMWVGVSTNGTSIPMIQIGDSGGIEATGYSGTVINQSITDHDGDAFSTGFHLHGDEDNSAANVSSGVLELLLFDASANTWVASINGCMTNTEETISGFGSKSLSATLDRVRLTTINGTDTFDAGSINILYE